MYLPRTAEKEIVQLSENFKVVLVSGMRQVGKAHCAHIYLTNARRPPA